VVDSGGVVFVEGGRVFDWLMRRTVSVDVFLTIRPETDPRDLQRGSPQFLGLFSEDPRASLSASPWPPKARLLVGVQADLVRAVTPVERGNRAVVVTWFTPAG
jgi:hypothetical protein